MSFYYSPLNPQVVLSSVAPEFMLCFQYFKAHIHASCMLDCFGSYVLKKKFSLVVGPPVKKVA